MKLLMVHFTAHLLFVRLGYINTLLEKIGMIFFVPFFLSFVKNKNFHFAYINITLKGHTLCALSTKLSKPTINVWQRYFTGFTQLNEVTISFPKQKGQRDVTDYFVIGIKHMHFCTAKTF